MKEITHTNIIETLVAQHNELREILTDIKKLSDSDDPDYSKIAKTQRRLTIKVKAHLKVENEIFYPCVLKGVEESGVTELVLESKKMFIEEMVVIEKEVHKFLKKYKTSAMIKDKWDGYCADLANIISVVTIRVESEEDGIYIEWAIFGSEECLKNKGLK